MLIYASVSEPMKMMPSKPPAACTLGEPPMVCLNIRKTPTVPAVERTIIMYPLMRWNSIILCRITGTNWKQTRKEAGRIHARCMIIPIRSRLPFLKWKHSPGKARVVLLNPEPQKTLSKSMNMSRARVKPMSAPTRLKNNAKL